MQAHLRVSLGKHYNTTWRGNSKSQLWKYCCAMLSLKPFIRCWLCFIAALQKTVTHWKQPPPYCNWYQPHLGPGNNFMFICILVNSVHMLKSYLVFSVVPRLKLQNRASFLVSWYSFSIVEYSLSWIRKEQSFSLPLICCNLGVSCHSFLFTGILWLTKTSSALLPGYSIQVMHAAASRSVSKPGHLLTSI